LSKINVFLKCAEPCWDDGIENPAVVDGSELKRCSKERICKTKPVRLKKNVIDEREGGG